MYGNALYGNRYCRECWYDYYATDEERCRYDEAEAMALASTERMEDLYLAVVRSWAALRS